MHISTRALVVTVMLALPTMGAWAQEPADGVVEGGAGWARFVDNAPIDRGVWSGGARWAVTRRVSIGPEVTYMNGPNEDRQWFFTGNATIDLGSPAAHQRLVPYLIAGGGLVRMTAPVGTGLYTSYEGTFTAGVGALIGISDHWYVAPEFRVGWELHTRMGVVGGLRF